jgi:hypothetical protein
VSGNGGGSALGSRVPKTGKSDRWQGSTCQRQRKAEKTGGVTCRQVESSLLTVSGFRRLERLEALHQDSRSREV